MLKIDPNANKIQLTRGDTAVLKIELKDTERNVYTPGVSDTIRFAMKRNYTDADVLVNVNAVIDGSDITITIPATATKELAFGSYKYDIQLTSGTGANAVVDTFIDRGTIMITEEVD